MHIPRITIPILLAFFFLSSCDKNGPDNCATFGAQLASGTIMDTIVLNGGAMALLTSTGECRFDTIILESPDTTITEPPEPDTIRTLIMGFGTSTIARWDLANAFPHKTMKKAGYKGIFIDDLLLLLDTIQKVDPEQVLLYAGSNDVIEGQTSAEVTTALQDLMRKIWEKTPRVHITFITLHASDTAFNVQSKTGLPGIETIELVNSNLMEWIDTQHSHHASYINSYSSFLAQNPKRLDLKYFEPDKLHLNQTHGYPLLNDLTAPKLK